MSDEDHVGFIGDISSLKALIIGNGVSRKNVDLNLFAAKYDITIGCNKVFEEFFPTYLITMDREAIKYAVNSEKLSDTFIWRSLIVPSIFDKNKTHSSNSGSIAIRTINNQFPDVNIDFIGFDSIADTPTNGENMYVYEDPAFAKREKLHNNNGYLSAHYQELKALKNKKVVIRYHMPIETKGRLFPNFVQNMLSLDNPVFIVFFDNFGNRVESLRIEKYCDIFDWRHVNGND